MTILVTGGNGFIGSNLIKKLVQEGKEVLCLDDLSAGLREYEVEGCTYHYQDIEELLFWQDKKIDLCYHLAGLSRIQPSYQQPFETFRVNTLGCQVVAEWARVHKVKVVYAGSSSKWHDPVESPYATTKKLGEDIFKMYKSVYGCNFEIARFYNVYGPNELVDSRWAAVTGIWRSQIKAGQPITVVGNGEQRRDFTHVEDIVDALVKIGFGNERHDDAWELGAGVNYSVNEVYEMFRERFGCSKIHVQDQKGNYRVTLRENDDALSRLQWAPKDRLREYIQTLI